MRKLLALTWLFAFAIPVAAKADGPLGTRADAYHAAGTLSSGDMILIVREGVPLTLTTLGDVWNGAPALNGSCSPHEWIASFTGGSANCSQPDISDVTGALSMAQATVVVSTINVLATTAGGFPTATQIYLQGGLAIGDQGGGLLSYSAGGCAPDGYLYFNDVNGRCFVRSQ